MLGARQMPDPQYRIFKSLAFSPDGQWLAFMGAARTPELKARIWVMPAGGGTPRGVTPDEMLALRAGWSPDGRSLLVFMNDRGTHGLWIVDPAGEQAPRRIPLPGGLDARMPEWSPAGDWIAAIEWAPGGQPRPTLLIRPDTGEIRRLPALDSAALVWAADGRTLFGVQNRAGTARLQAIDVAGGALRTVADYGVPLNLTEDLGAVVRYSLTPDGCAFTTTRLTSRADLWMITGLPR
jgi:TolB protein